MSPTIQPGRRSAALRRDLGPVAWCALECLVERSADGRTSEASIRTVAAELGVAKNTAHRALAALARAGLIESDQSRAGDGRYQRGHYRLRVEDLLTSSLSETAAPRLRPRHRATRAEDDAQLTLLGNG